MPLIPNASPEHNADVLLANQTSLLNSSSIDDLLDAVSDILEVLKALIGGSKNLSIQAKMENDRRILLLIEMLKKIRDRLKDLVFEIQENNTKPGGTNEPSTVVKKKDF